MRLHSKLRSALILTAALASTAQIALPVLAQGTIAPAKVDSASYGPVVTIVSPEYSDVIKGETQIEIAIAPRKYPAQSVELLVDGRSVSGVLPVQTKFAWKTGMFIDGPHTLGVRVTDSQGFIGQSETTIYVNNARKPDNNSPILRWLGVSSGTTLSGITKFRLEAADDFGVKYVFLNLNTAIAPDIKPPLASWMTNRPPYEFSLDTTKFKDGTYVLDAYAWDDMDNERNALRLTIKLANQTELEIPLKRELPTPLFPEKIPTETWGFPAKPPTVPPSVSVFTPPRSGAMTAQPATAFSAVPSSLRNTGADLSSKISSPPTTFRQLPKTSKAPGVNQAPKAESPKAEGMRVAVIPQFPTRSAGTPALSSIEKVLQGRTTQIASTPAAASVPERRERALIVLATAPELKPRVTREVRNPIVQVPVIEPSEVRITPEITVSSQQKNPGSVAVAIAPSADSTRLAREHSLLPTAPGTRIAEISPVQKLVRPAAINAVTNTSTPTTDPSLRPLDDIVALSHRTDNRGFQVTAPDSEMRFAALGTDVAPPKNAGSPALSTPEDKSTSGSIASILPDVATDSPNSFTHRTGANEMATRPLFSAIPDFRTKPATRAQLTFDAATNTPFVVPLQTRIAEKQFVAPVKFTRISTLPTLPRLAAAPIVTWSDKGKSENAITIAPISASPSYYTATQYEDLTAIAARYKMPVSALAAANKLPLNARVAKGTRVLLPQALTVSYQGQNITGDVAPLLIGSTSVAPFRFLFEKQGGKMTWDAEGRRVTARNGSYEVSLEIGSDKAIVNQEEVLMDMAAFLLSGRTMVPVRFFEKALHAKVEWEPSTGRIFVAMTLADS